MEAIKARKVGKTVIGHVPSSTNPDEVHTIYLEGTDAQHPADRWVYCSCKGWKLRRMKPLASVRCCAHVLEYSRTVLATRPQDRPIHSTVAAWNVKTGKARVREAVWAAVAYNYLRSGGETPEALIAKVREVLAHGGISQRLKDFATSRAKDAFDAMAKRKG